MRIMTIYGTRPEAIKVAPVIKAIEEAPDLESITVVTGQHREMLDQVNALFEIVPDHDMNIMSAGQSLNMIVAKVVGGIDPILDLEAPDVVIVQGDTSTVMGAAIAAFNRQIPVVHLEAGLRSGNIRSPFPEEANRRLTTQITTLHLAPTATSKENLLAEGISESAVCVTGNTVIDALLRVIDSLDIPFDDERLAQLERDAAERGTRQVLLVTAHRRENLGSAMEEIGDAIVELASSRPELTIIFPIHRNPRVRESILPKTEGITNILVIEPLEYAQFARLLNLADVILTDSGGVQEEAPSLGKPLLVMRENTERPEAVTAGTVKLIGTRRRRIIDEVSELLDNKAAYDRMANATNPYGDGLAASRVVEAIRWTFMGSARPLDYDSSNEQNRAQ